MNEPDKFPEEDNEDWFNHPGTVAKARFWFRLRDELQAKLNAVCLESTDPKVRYAYAKFESAVATLATLVPPKKDMNGKR